MIFSLDFYISPSPTYHHRWHSFEQATVPYKSLGQDQFHRKIVCVVVALDVASWDTRKNLGTEASSKGSSGIGLSWVDFDLETYLLLLLLAVGILHHH